MSETIPPPQALIAKWQQSGDDHEVRADEFRAAGDEMNFERQDAYAYAARLHASQLEAALSAARPQQQKEQHDALDALERFGYRRCDIMACNCNGWHGGHSAARLAEIGDALADAGIDLNGRTILEGVRLLILSVDRLRGEGHAPGCGKWAQTALHGRQLQGDLPCTCGAPLSPRLRGEGHIDR